MSNKTLKLPYRRSVGIMLINKCGRVWVGRRVPKWQKDPLKYIWQMPQGGIEEGEKPRQAALRELKEEIGTDNVKVLGKNSGWIKYDLPDKLLGVALGGKYRGHQYKWYVMAFCGSDDEIDITGKKGFKAEFDDWLWVDIMDVEGLGVAFKEKLYQRVIKELSRFAGDPSKSATRKSA